jgi:N-acyl-D-amino-acid deacylase
MIKRVCQMLVIVAAGLAIASRLGLSVPMARADGGFDIVIRGGRIVDGTGAPWYLADIGIRDGKIAAIGRISAASDAPSIGQTIDATGLVVAPGFVDMMGQSATPLMEHPEAALNLLTQGITTINAGEGVSAAPLSSDQGNEAGWTTMAEYFQLLEMAGLPLNVAQTVGHTQVRRIVLGDVDRRPSDDELEQMCTLVREGMQAGAIGVSTALIYPPAIYAQAKEIAALVAAASESGGHYFTHMRNEGDLLIEAIDEALEIGRTGNAPVHIFHLKAAGRQNWGKMPLAIARIRAARAVGQQVTADIYPYTHNGLGIAAFVHPRHFAAGHAALVGRLDDAVLRATIRHEMESTDGWENWFRHVGHDWNRVVIGQANAARYAPLAGKSVAEIAQALNEDAWLTFFELLRTGAFALPESMTEANKILAMREEFVSFCTDVGPAAGGASIASHPRAYGSFPRLLSRYVRDLGAIPLERAVAQASAAACNHIMAYDRGRIVQGLAADLVVFDFDSLADKSTFSQPDAVSQGVRFVLVNGALVLDEGKFTGKRPGHILRGPGYRDTSASHAVASGSCDARLASFDRLMRDFMQRHRVPGAAIAVTDQGRLVLARGYGYADVATREPVQPTSLFRIASISKPITAVAILRLIEQGRLGLDDKVFAVLERGAELESNATCDPRLQAITIRHLLEHRGGWDRDQSFDPMFRAVEFADQLGIAAPAGPHDVIRAMLGQKLEFDPGLRYAYSNFGYCLLGRVIEKRSGQTYEEYVRQHVLAPLGIERMQLGKTSLAERVEGEVRYYHPGSGESVFQANRGSQVPWTYGAWNLHAMDSHGGWIASAIDLARFACAFDQTDRCPILGPDSINLMHQRPPGLAGCNEQGEPNDVYYSLGWMNRVIDPQKLNHWHTGSLPGTATILIRRHDGRNFVALLNSRVSPQGSGLGSEIDQLLHQAANDVTEWPRTDLFPSFAQPSSGTDGTEQRASSAR